MVINTSHLQPSFTSLARPKSATSAETSSAFAAELSAAAPALPRQEVQPTQLHAQQQSEEAFWSQLAFNSAPNEEAAEEEEAVLNYRTNEKQFRPPLPISFAFGIPRPRAVAVMMRHPIVGNEAPASRAQAILETLQLAATDRLPYLKGAGFYVAA
ncbi:hypothetical protein V6U78_09655 [Marinospirillum sp. MEB164]|uniref:Uncharacterized protein n=1 Tax=Marinospirillum alkalitolerans TaxID=3123374 RepID=A0ABW8PYG7_9GAMM